MAQASPARQVPTWIPGKVFLLTSAILPAAVKFSWQESDFLLETSKKKPEDWPVHKIVYLSLGSNLGDRSLNLHQAIEKLGELGKVAAVSSFYDTEPVELTAQPWFLNCVAKLDTEKMPRQLIAAILAIEQDMGRQRKQQKGPRTIDIDILLFGSSIIDIPSLTVPHPKLHQRRFVLEPLAEIAPEVRHPLLKRTAREMRDALPAGQTVKRVTPH
jgi:2-amino-4-hydroxy-6-hydroxymethyldihydropteridine diphosphokinase